MFETFFGLQENPFSLTPDPKYLFLSAVHKEALSHLRYGIEKRSGFVLVTGEVGAGKTTICRQLLKSLPHETHTALILHPSLSAKELLQTINQEFGLDAVTESKKELLDGLYAFLLEVNARGENAVLIIDECQNLDPDVLEQIRMLSNFETEKEKLLQILLVGQPELAAMLESPNLRQLNDRILLRYHMGPLSPDDTGEYIKHRLAICGAHGAIRFTGRAIRRIYVYSSGYPRKINAVAERALLLAYLGGTQRIDEKTIRQAIAEIKGSYADPPRKGLSGAVVSMAVVMVFMLAFMGIIAYDDGGRLLSKKPSFDPPAADGTSLMTHEPDMTPADDTNRATPASGDGLALDFSRHVIPEFDGAIELLRTVPGGGRGTEILNLHPAVEYLSRINAPFVAMVQGGYCVVLGINDGYVRITDGNRAVIEVPLSDFARHYRWNVVMNYAKCSGSKIYDLDDVGAEVAQIQQVLRGFGYLQTEPNGHYGLETARGVEKIQEVFGLRRDGIVGPETMEVFRLVGES